MRGSASVCERTNLGMFLVPRKTGLMCGRSAGRPHGRFTTQEGLVCGRSAVRPHAILHAHTMTSVWAFAISPARPSPLPHPSCWLPCVLQCTWQLPLVCFIRRWQLSFFTRVCHVFCRVHDNCPSVLVSRWQLSLYPKHVILPCLFVALHDNCLVLVGGNS